MKNPKEDLTKCYCGHTIMCDCSPQDESKQETLEEVAEKYSREVWGVYYDDVHPDIAITETQGEISVKDFSRGAKWQQERMYSDEEVIGIVQKLMYDVHCGDITNTDFVVDFKISPIKWFEQFKKK
jgi:hypothetical protein